MRLRLVSLPFLLAASIAGAQATDTVRVAYSSARCPRCAGWDAPQRPARIYGNTWYVGTHALSSILITSPAGHVLIDGALPQSAPQIAANIRSLGFRVEDVKVILNSHAHHDHAGGIAEVQRLSGADVIASPWSAGVIGRGESDDQDPQFGLMLPYPAARAVRVVQDGETIRVGPLALTARFTAGHTPGGTSWSWRSCEGAACLDLLYADSQTAVSADGFFFTRSTTYRTGPSDFERGLATLERLPCDILLTPHPEVASLWDRLAARDSGRVATIADRAGCRGFVTAARRGVAKRMESERARP